MQSSSEYASASAGGLPCNYSTMAGYTHQASSAPFVGAPRASSARSNQIVIVPSYGGPGYNTLSQPAASNCCGGYYPVSSAYPNYPNACGHFTSNLCG